MSSNDLEIDINKGIVSYFVNRPLLVNVFIIMVFLVGTMSFLQMKRDQFPEVDMNRSTVITSFPGASAQDVELKVTKVLEDRIRTIANIKRFYSTSMENTSIIVVDFIVDLPKEKADEARADLRTQVDNAQGLLPPNATTPDIENIDKTSIPIVYYMVSSDHLSEQQMREVMLELDNSFRGVDGVKDVIRIGFRNREYQILGDTKKMLAERMTLASIAAVVSNYNIRNGGGSVDQENRNRNIITDSLFQGIPDLANLTLRENFSGENVKAKDIGEVNMGFAPATKYARSERSNGILLQIQKQTRADIITTVDALDAIVLKTKDALQKEYGSQLNIIKTYDTTVDIRDMLSITWENGWEGFVLVYLIMWIFLDMRTAWWAAFNIPVSMFMTFIWVYFAYDYGFNMITMFGLITVIGIVVDQGIVVAENIYQKLEEGLDPKRATIVGTNQVARAVIAAVAVTIMAFAPLLLIGEILGNFMRPIPVVVVVSLICSTIEVFVSLPSHILHSAKKKLEKAEKSGKPMVFYEPGERVAMGWFSLGYKACLRRVLRFRYVAVLVAILIFYSALQIGKTIDFELFSDKQGTVIQMSFEAPQGYTIDQTYRIIKFVEDEIIKDVPYGKELRTLTTQVGIRRDAPTNPNPEEANTAYLQVLLVPSSQRVRPAVEISNDLRKRFAANPRFTSVFRRMTINTKSAGPPSDADFQWRISSGDDKLLKKVDLDLEAFVNGLKGVYGVDNTEKRVHTTLLVHMKDDIMNRLGVDPATVSKTILTAYQGTVSPNYIPDIWDPNYMRVSLAERYQRDQGELSNLLIPASRNQQVHLSQVADIKEAVVPYVFYHYNGRLSYTVNGFVDKTVNTPLAVDQAIRTQFIPKYKNTPNLWISQSGEGENMDTAFSGTKKAVVVATIAILVILILTLNSFIQSLFLLIVIPFSLTGVLYGFFLQNTVMGFFGIVGILGLAGVVVNHAVVLVDIINHRFDRYPINKHYTPGYQDFLVTSCETRLRPIILTTCCTVLGLIPAIYGLGGSNDFLKPLAIALADGLLAGMLLTIFLIPCFYHIQRDIQVLIRSKSSTETPENTEK